MDTLKAEKYTVGQWMDICFENYAKIKVRRAPHETCRGCIDDYIKSISAKFNRIFCARYKNISAGQDDGVHPFIVFMGSYVPRDKTAA